MGDEAKDSQFNTITAKPLHPTFATEISNVDFSKPLSDEVSQEIHKAVTKVNPPHTRYWQFYFATEFTLFFLHLQSMEL
jgi:hypothetical protein